MPQTERSVTLLTGAMVAALYVILIVGAGQETCMRRRVSGEPLPVRALDQFVHLPLCPRPAVPRAPARAGGNKA